MSDEVCRCTVTKFHGIPDTSNCQIHATPPPTVPRVARSVDDLRVGMVVACYLPGGDPELDGGVVASTHPDETLIKRYGDDGPTTVLYQSSFCDTQVFILADPPARDWLVPAPQMEALKEAMVGYDGESLLADRSVLAAASAVLDAAREVEHE